MEVYKLVLIRDYFGVRSYSTDSDASHHMKSAVVCNELSATYEMGKTLKNYDMPYLAFKSKKEAFSFRCLIIDTNNLRLVKCLAVKSKYNPSKLPSTDKFIEIYEFWKCVKNTKKRPYVCGMTPRGTVFCSEITPLEFVKEEKED